MVTNVVFCLLVLIIIKSTLSYAFYSKPYGNISKIDRDPSIWVLTPNLPYMTPPYLTSVLVMYDFANVSRTTQDIVRTIKYHLYTYFVAPFSTRDCNILLDLVIYIRYQLTLAQYMKKKNFFLYMYIFYSNSINFQYFFVGFSILS